MRRRCHPCPGCGHDLVAVRVRIEPTYGLPIVTCPTCSTVVVRRRTSLETLWRKTRRNAVIGWLFGWQIVLAIAVPLTFLGLSIGMGDLFRAHGLGVVREDEWVALVMGGIVVPIMAGTWLAAGLGHWRRFVPHVVCAALVLLLLATALTVELLDRVLHDLIRYGGYDPDSAHRAWNQFTFSAGALLVLMMVSLIGVPLASGMFALQRSFERSARQWHRNRLRGTT